MNRETWLGQLAEKMAPRFAELGHPLPPVRMAIGFTGRGKHSKAIGECWSSSASADKVHEILIRPDQADPMSVAATLAHELAHAAVGLESGHTGKFAKAVLAIGLKRPLTATSAGPGFVAWVQPMLDAMEPFPRGKLSWGVKAPRARRDDAGSMKGGEEPAVIISSSGPPKQSTRMLKVSCTTCGYVVRTTQKWLDVGVPHCPVHGAMAAQTQDDGKD